MNPMNQLRITKVCVNIGVGEGGERLVNAENVLEMVTGVKPQRTSVASKPRPQGPCRCTHRLQSHDAQPRAIKAS